jgi:hypothetical protein
LISVGVRNSRRAPSERRRLERLKSRASCGVAGAGGSNPRTVAQLTLRRRSNGLDRKAGPPLALGVVEPRAGCWPRAGPRCAANDEHATHGSVSSGWFGRADRDDNWDGEEGGREGNRDEWSNQEQESRQREGEQLNREDPRPAERFVTSTATSADES